MKRSKANNTQGIHQIRLRNKCHIYSSKFYPKNIDLHHFWGKHYFMYVLDIFVKM